MVANDRHERIRELRRAGHAVGDVAERLSVSRQTVWRACKGLEPVPTPAPAPASNGHVVDLEAARSLGLGVLVQRAQLGSVSAAAHVFRQASAELRAEKCLNHLPVEHVIQSARIQFSYLGSKAEGFIPKAFANGVPGHRSGPARGPCRRCD